MAFKDIDVVLYDGRIKIEYRDKAHRYYRRDLQPDGTWGKARPTRGVTTIIGDTLEKKGLQTWPMGLALKELFGFYDFTNEKGDRMTGFSKGKGTLWSEFEDDGRFLNSLPERDLLPLVLSASKAWTRKQKQGADIGSLVHDAIEQFVLAHRDHRLTDDHLVLTLEHYREGQEFENAEVQAEWEKNAPGEVAMGQLAFDRFVGWWTATRPELVGAEDLVYSEKLDYCGTFDGLIRLDGNLILCDWKTSNASESAGAPQGVYYSYFIQSAAYAAAWEEMGREPIDDLMIVSARKDGNFDTVLLSQLDMTVAEAANWWRATMLANVNMNKLKKGLVALAKGEK